jgi:hypothetical protein
MAASHKSEALRAAGYGRLGAGADAGEDRLSTIAEELLVHLIIEGEAGRGFRTHAICSAHMRDDGYLVFSATLPN